MENVFKILGEGDPAGTDEAILVHSTGGWLLIIPWGYDYGCGISHIFSLTDSEKEDVEKMSFVFADEIIKKFEGKANLALNKENSVSQEPREVPTKQKLLTEFIVLMEKYADKMTFQRLMYYLITTVVTIIIREGLLNEDDLVELDKVLDGDK